jgi:hypothetical protein
MKLRRRQFLRLAAGATAVPAVSRIARGAQRRLRERKRAHAGQPDAGGTRYAAANVEERAS